MRSRLSENKASADGNRPGGYALEEIISQPACWSTCLKQLPQSITAEKLVEKFAGVREWLFVGCGSSYYIALAAAASCSVITGLRARAVPASELLLYPDLALSGASDVAAVMISRSGRTSETLRATELLERERHIRTLGVTCAEGTPLQQIATGSLVLLAADERSTVMTRSFTSLLIGLQYLAARITDRREIIDALDKLASSAQPALSALNPRIRDFAGAHRFADYICLGQGPLYGLACECALKLTEMSVSYAQSYHTLEFRHGPKSVVSPDTLIMFLLSENGFDAEREVLEEMKALGGVTLAVVNRADDRVRAASDFLVEFGFDLPEVARLAPYVWAGQLMGLYTGLNKGLDPDNPRNLSRVVILDDDNSGKAEHAAL